MKTTGGTLFLLGIFLIGILTIFPYGSYLDQQSEQRIVFANIKEYLIRLPGEEPGLVKDFTDAGILRISEDEDRDHGMAAYYPVFWIWYVNQVSPWAGSLIWHIYTFVLVFLGICALYFLGKELFGSVKAAGFMTLLFFLTPRMFAESHYNNKDMVLLSLTFILFFLAFRLMKNPSWKNVVLFAVAGAAAANLKIVGIWIFGVLGICGAVYLIRCRRLTREILLKMVSCMVLWALLYALLTPALWENPVSFFQYLFSYAVDYDLWHDYVLFQGRMVHQEYTGMPRKYLPVMMLLTIPVGILILALAGGILLLGRLALSKGRKFFDKEGFLFILILIDLVPFAYAVFAATPLYNGWRHFYFLFAPIVIVAGYFAWSCWGWCRGRGKLLFGLFQGGYLAFLALGILWNYPYEHSFYNILAGKNVEERFELDYWDMSVHQALEEICRDAGEGRTASVGAADNPTHWGITGNWKILSRENREKIHVKNKEDWREADYVVVNMTYSFMYSQEEYKEIKSTHRLIWDCDSYGNTICQVWKRETG